MKAKKRFIQPEQDFAFAEPLFTLRGELATQGEPPKQKAKDTTGDLFAESERPKTEP